MSWREGVAGATQEELDNVFAHSLNLAERMLKKHGEFYPFALFLDRARGEIRPLNIGDSRDRPPSSDVLTRLYDAARTLVETSPEVTVIAFVSDIAVAGKDAIRVEMEHGDGVSIAILARYALKGFGKRVVISEISAHPSLPRLWL